MRRGYNNHNHNPPPPRRGGGGSRGGSGSGPRQSSSDSYASSSSYSSGSTPRRIINPISHIPSPSNNNPSLETVVARLETICKLLHAVSSNCTRPDEILSEIKLLAEDLRRVGPALETAYPDVLDRVISSMRDASSHPTLPPALRLAIFQLVELRAAHWSLPLETHNYYKERAQGIWELDGLESGGSGGPTIVIGNGELPLSLSETCSPEEEASVSGGEHGESGNTGGAGIGTGKAYRQEIIIKNSDSGKVMGVRGRRVHLIETLSDTIISFEKINPSAKERILSVHGQSYQAINMARDLIQETIQRNASPELDIEVENKNLLLHNDTPENNAMGSTSGSAEGTGNSSPVKDPQEIPFFSYSVHLGSEDVIKISGNNLQYVQEAKLSLDEYFCAKYPELFYLSSEEYGGSGATNNSVPNGNGRLQYGRELLLKLGQAQYPQPMCFTNLEPSIKESIILKKCRNMINSDGDGHF